MKKLNQKLFLAGFFLVLGLAFLAGAVFLIEPEVMEITPPHRQDDVGLIEEIEEKEITIMLVGDIMLDRGVRFMIDEHGAEDFRFPFLRIADYLKGADIVFGNLESVISDKGTMVGSIYSFRAVPKAIEGLIYAGFDVVSVANNHIFDYGREAMEDSFLRLREAGIDFVGGGFNEKEAYDPVIKEIENTKIAFLAYTNLGSPHWAAKGENSGIAWLEEERIKEDVKEAKKQADLIIVSLHYGDEYQLKPNPFQISISRVAIDAGADLVAGHHSHVIQPVEKYNQGHIAYSLGNFIFDQSFSEETMKGLLLEVVIKGGKIKEVIPLEAQINQYYQPEIPANPIIREIKSETEQGTEEAFLLSIEERVSVFPVSLRQGDTLVVKIKTDLSVEEINASLGLRKINFFGAEENLVGILGIPVREKPGEYNLIINFPNGEQYKKSITVVERNFPVTKLAVTEKLEDEGHTPTKIQERVAQENVKLAGALNIFTPRAYFEQFFVYPLDRIRDVGAFGNIRKSGEIELQHLGVDLQADIGMPVYAINGGLVRLTEDFFNYGKTIVIDHGLGIFSLYLHLDDFKVWEGKEVERGEVIAFSGNTGYSLAPHLHLGIKVSGVSLDPLKFIETVRREME